MCLFEQQLEECHDDACPGVRREHLLLPEGNQHRQ